MSRVTLRIIAEASGLSKFAVSRALAGKSGVSDATRARVLEIAERLGYQRLEKNGDRKLLAAVFDDPDAVNGELHARIQGGMQFQAAQFGYVVRPHWLHHGDDFEATLDSCAGIFAVNVRDQDALSKIAASGRAVVHNGWLDPLDPVDTVGGTDREAGGAVGRFLVELGHREIVYVHGSQDLRGRRERLYGLHEVVERIPGTIYHDMVWDENESFTDTLNALLSTGADPTAFFCAHDGLALTVVTDLLARGWNIPEDVSVVGFGDFSPAQLIRPALTTLRVPGHQIGRAAVHLLHTRLTDRTWLDAPVRLKVVTNLVVRSSTGPASLRLARGGQRRARRAERERQSADDTH